MSEQVGEVLLPNLISGEMDTAIIIEGLDAPHITCLTNDWASQLHATGQQIVERHQDINGDLDVDSCRAELADNNVQDFAWRWRLKWTHYQDDLSKVFFAIECDGQTQGVMLVDNASYRCRQSGCEGDNLIYIEYLATAPWNRPQLVPQPKYSKIGKVLIGTAISLSIEEEFNGRIGLHSLPQADTYYATTCGMTDFGIDTEKENLRYFEMTEQQAHDFLS